MKILHGLPVFFRLRWNKTATMEAMQETTTPSTVVFFRPILNRIIKTIKIYKTPPVLHQHDLFTFCSLVQFGVVGAFWYVEI